MKFFIVFAVLLAVAVARPNAVEIVRSESDVEPEKFNFAYETSDGTAHQASGVLHHVGSEHESLAVHGSYQYVSDDGHTYSVKYVADEHGFQPEGAHIPVAPEVHH